MMESECGGVSQRLNEEVGVRQIACKEVGGGRGRVRSEQDLSIATKEDNQPEDHSHGDMRSVDGKATGFTDSSGKRLRWQGSRSQMNFERARQQCQHNTFLSCHPPYGPRQSQLANAESVGECLNDSDIPTRIHTSRPAYTSGYMGGHPGSASACVGMLTRAD